MISLLLLTAFFASFLQQHTIFAVQYSLNNTHEGMVHYVPSVVLQPCSLPADRGEQFNHFFLSEQDSIRNKLIAVIFYLFLLLKNTKALNVKQLICSSESQKTVNSIYHLRGLEQNICSASLIDFICSVSIPQMSKVTSQQPF